MENILKLINAELDSISLELLKTDDTLDFYRNFRSNNSFTDLQSVCNCNYRELAIALIMCNEPDLDVNFVSGAINNVKGIVDLCNDKDDIFSILDYLNELLELGLYQEAIDIFSKKKKVSFFDLFKKSTISIRTFEEFLKGYKINSYDFVAFMELYRSNKSKVIDAFTLISDFKALENDMNNSSANIDFVSEIFGTTLKEKNKTKYVTKSISNRWNIGVLMAPVKEMVNYGHSLELRDSSKKRMLRKQARVYEDLKDKLSKAMNGGEIQKYMDLIIKIPNERIRLEILKLVYLHNMQIYDSMKSEYEDLSSNSVAQYKVLLSKSGIDCSKCDISLVMRNSLDDVTSMIALFECLGIDDPTLIFNILKISNLSTVSFLNSLHKSGVIDSDLLVNHIELFDETSTLFKVFNSNIELLKELNINPKCFEKSSSSLIIPNEIFKKNILTLNDYSLLSSFSAECDYSFLRSSFLHVAIDTLLELRYEDFLVADLSILNYQDRFKRLRLLKDLNIPVTSLGDLIDVLSTDKFYVNDEDIDSYLYNAVPYNIPDVKRCEGKQNNFLDLDSFSNGGRTYNFGGVLISKNKVERNSAFLSSTESLNDRRLFSIMQGSVLSDLEVDCIMEALGIEKKFSFVKKIES